MTISSIGSSSDLASIRARFQQFKNGAINVSKDELTKLKGDLSTKGKSTNKVDNLLTNFDQIDKNGDGISFNELMSYKQTTAPETQGTDAAAGSAAHKGHGHHHKHAGAPASCNSNSTDSSNQATANSLLTPPEDSTDSDSNNSSNGAFSIINMVLKNYAKASNSTSNDGIASLLKAIQA